MILIHRPILERIGQYPKPIDQTELVFSKNAFNILVIYFPHA